MRVIAVVLGLLAATFESAASPAAISGQIPDHFTNLQVVGKSIPRAALVDIMKQFTSDLNVRCEFCHVGGPELSTFDFAADDKPAKKTARRMMTMLVAINRDWLKDIGQPSADPKVTCYTCHRSAPKPLTGPPGRAGGVPRW